MNQIAIRRAVLADLDAVRRVGELTWPPTYGPLLGAAYVEEGLARWWSREVVERGIRDLTTWVVEDAGSVVGVAVVGRVDDHDMLWKLYVLPDYHGRGVGRALLTTCIEAADGGELRLDCAEGNDHAYGFYRSHGFVEVERHAADDGHREIRMARPASA